MGLGVSSAKNLEFPPDDETNRRSEVQIRFRSVKPLNANQIKFVVQQAIRDADLVSSIKRKLSLPDDKRSDTYLAPEVMKFIEFCQKIGIPEDEYSVLTAFLPFVKICEPHPFE
jgi:hypothetical protein